MNQEETRKAQTLQVHKAKWVVPVSAAPIPNGAVATFGGRIAEVGPASELSLRFHGPCVDHGESILCPGLINAHSHLELSPLKYRLYPTSSFTGWIRALLDARNRIEPQELDRAVRQAMDEMHSGGIIAVGDIGNTGLVPEIASKNEALPIQGIFFNEIICQRPDPKELVNEWLSFTKRESRFFNFAVSAHAPYTVSPEAIRVIKSVSKLRRRPFSVHVSESMDEMEFLTKKDGPLRKLLEEKGHWPLSYNLPDVSPVAYLSSLNVLDADTICVHCVHLDGKDVEIMAASKSTACLCPRSNLFLGVGFPPAERLFKAGIPIAIGTDSLASNDRLSIFAEMASLANIAPGLNPEVVFKAATYGGARALGIQRDFGTLSQGKAAKFITINASDVKENEIYDFLVSGCDSPDLDCHWIKDDQLL